MKAFAVTVAIACSVNAIAADKASVWKKGDPLSYRPPRIFEAVVTASVTAQGNLYFYSYAVYNSTRNPVALYRFELDLRAKPEKHPFSLKDISVSHTPNDHDQALYKVDRVQPKETSGPAGWTFFEEQNLPVIPGVWSTNDAGAYGIVIKPGRRLSGFGLLAEEPPGIRKYAVNAHDTTYDSWLQQQPAAMWDYYLKSEDLAAEQNQGIEYLGKTIAPVAPPEPFTASTWTAHMQSLAEEARRLDWIRSDEALRHIKGLVGRLDTDDKKQLKKAVREIENFVLAEKRSGKITEEADALIRLNALYLINRLD